MPAAWPCASPAPLAEALPPARGRRSSTVRGRLFALTLLLLLPGIGFSINLVLHSYVSDREHAESGLRDTARVLALGIDRQFLQAEVLLRTLAETGDLARGDIAAFTKLARSTAVLGGHLVLLRRDGHQLMNTALPEDADLPDQEPPAGWDREIPGHAFVTGLALQPVSAELAATVVLPLAPRGAHEMDLVLIFPLAAMQSLLAQQPLPEGWGARILDPSRKVVAAAGAHALPAGALAEPDIAAALARAPSGVQEVTLAGKQTVMAHARSNGSGWMAMTTAASAAITADARANLRDLILNGVAMLGMGMAVALGAARSITNPIEAVARAARALGDSGNLPKVPEGLAETDAVADAFVTAADALRERATTMAQINETLAERVAARTAELAEVNRRLEDQRAQLGLILDNMPFGVVVSQLDNAVVYANPEARRLLGAGDEALSIKHMPKLTRLGRAVPTDILPGRLAAQGLRVEREVLRAQMHDGRVLDLEVTAGPVHDQSGQITLSVASFQDISDRLQAEEVLRRAQRLEAVGQLTGGVAHEFNNLLMAITGSLDLLAPLVPPGRAGVLLDGAGRAAERGARLTKQLLAFSRRQHLQTQAVDLNALVSGMAELLASAVGRGVELTTDLAQDAATAIADPAQLELVLLNLSINARDAMPGGGRIVVATRNVTRGAPQRPEDPPAGNYVALSVRDSGTGMTPEVLARVFEPFFTTKEIGHGTGLGLPQVLGVAQQLGGGVAIDSTPGQGTTVTVFLRLAETAARATASDRPRAPQPRVLEGVAVLLVDDDPDVRGVARDILTAMGASVAEADGGLAALSRLAADGAPDIVLADLTMPGMTGIELARMIGQQYPGLPVVVMTGYSATALDQLPESVVATLLKPFRANQLVDALASGLARGKAAATPPAED